jgi:hypothetical protein
MLKGNRLKAFEKEYVKATNRGSARQFWERMKTVLPNENISLLI